MNRELKILIVEFNNEDLKAIESVFKKAKLIYTSRRVVTKESFLRELKEFKPDFIIADYYLPQFSAEEALDIITKKKLSIPFIVISSIQSEGVAVSIVNNGSNNYILKKNLDRLPGEIDNALKKHKIQKQKIKTSKALKANEDLFRLISENLNDLISVLDKDGKILYASPSFRFCIGYNPNKLNGKRCINLVHPDDKGLFLKLFNNSKINKEI